MGIDVSLDDVLAAAADRLSDDSPRDHLPREWPESDNDSDLFELE